MQMESIDNDLHLHRWNASVLQQNGRTCPFGGWQTDAHAETRVTGATAASLIPGLLYLLSLPIQSVIYERWKISTQRKHAAKNASGHLV